jgi:hypothetical protein
MAGTFSHEDIYRVNIMLVQELNKGGQLGVDTKDDAHIFQ